uniref:Dipeptidyl peptidase 8 n=1 Tax=Prolemur simus TaxID=1328070 RepID=A0A8C8YZM4_PROSS
MPYQLESLPLFFKKNLIDILAIGGVQKLKQLQVAVKFLEFYMKKMMNLRWKLFMLHPLCWKQGGQIHSVILKQAQQILKSLLRCQK